jgi:hypothetical protein
MNECQQGCKEGRKGNKEGGRGLERRKDIHGLARSKDGRKNGHIFIYLIYLSIYIQRTTCNSISLLYTCIYYNISISISI